MQELEKILEEIKEVQNEYELQHAWCFSRGAERAANIIRKHLSRENGSEITILSRDNGGWIPVDERLPEVGEYVLGTTKSGEVLIFRYGWNSTHSKKMFFHLCGAAAIINAWRPLPEPCRTERSVEE